MRYFFLEKIAPEFVCISLDLEDISLLIVDMYCDDVYLALLAITVLSVYPFESHQFPIARYFMLSISLALKYLSRISPE